jgi:hypothetical protein
MAHYRLTTPLTEEQTRPLRVGDTVTIDGTIFGIRDANLIRMFDREVPAPCDLVGAACIHTAPSLKKVGNKWEPVVVGTTTSTRVRSELNSFNLIHIDPPRIRVETHTWQLDHPRFAVSQIQHFRRSRDGWTPV